MKNNSEQAKRNRNNKNRGAKFEKTVAKILNMHCVPYSGSNAQFGYGDVRCNEGTGDTPILVECKNFQLDKDRYKLKGEWISKNNERAEKYNAISVLAFVKSASILKFIYLDTIAMNKLGILDNHRKINVGEVKVNIFIAECDMKSVKVGEIVDLIDKNNNLIGCVMRIETFKPISDNYRASIIHSDCK